jgi:hypothetical protein
MLWVACGVAVKRGLGNVGRLSQHARVLCRSVRTDGLPRWPLLAKAAVTTDMVFRLLMTHSCPSRVRRSILVAPVNAP